MGGGVRGVKFSQLKNVSSQSVKKREKGPWIIQENRFNSLGEEKECGANENAARRLMGAPCKPWRDGVGRESTLGWGERGGTIPKGADNDCGWCCIFGGKVENTSNSGRKKKNGWRR